MTTIVHYDQNLCVFFELYGEKYYLERSGDLYAYIKVFGRWIKKKHRIINYKVLRPAYSFPKDGKRNGRVIYIQRLINHFFLGVPSSELDQNISED